MSLREYPSIFGHDLRFGCRQFRAAPVTAIVATASLAIGIGANTTIFSVVRTVLLVPGLWLAPFALVGGGFILQPGSHLVFPASIS